MTGRPVGTGAVVARLAGLVVALLAAMWYRRPDQFRHPYIWVEDGSRNLPDFIAHGWSFVLDPLQGYITLPSRVLFGMAASASFRWLPEIGFVLALCFTYLVLVAVAMSPTALRRRFLCAVALLVLPSNPEAYGVSLYTLWWGSVLVLLPLLWPARSDAQLPLRAVLLGVGGLSTPLCAGVWPLYAARFTLWRLRSDGWLLVGCSLLSMLQLGTVWVTSTSLSGRRSIAPVTTVVMKFFGQYVLWIPHWPERSLYVAVGLALLGVLAVSVFVRRKTLDWPFVALTGCLAVAIALAVVRVPIDVMHPVVAGGRYFFLPYLLLSWLLLYLIDTRHLATSVCCATALALSLAGFATHGRWRHAAIDWRGHVEQCLQEPTHQFPVHYEGTQSHGIIWSVEIEGAACRQLVSGSLFDNKLPAAAPPFPP